MTIFADDKLINSMKSFLILLTLLFLLAACTPAQSLTPLENAGTSTATAVTMTEMVEYNSAPDTTLTPSGIPSVVLTPTPTRTLQPTLINPTLSAVLALEATVVASGVECEAPARFFKAEISPDGNWIAMVCEGKWGEIDGYLRVVNLQGEEDWIIRFSDYAHGLEYDSRDRVYPFHWSQGGKYLYATSPSKFSGCCWLGYGMFLVRLDLETGRQTEIVNVLKPHPRIPAIDFSFSPSDRYLLYIPQDANHVLHILDLLTWKARGIKLDYEGLVAAGYTLMSNYEDKVILVILEWGEEIGDQAGIVGSLVVIDLEDGSQKRLVTSMPYREEYRPVKWEDQDHVLLSRRGDEQWLLNVQTAELTEVKP